MFFVVCESKSFLGKIFECWTEYEWVDLKKGKILSVSVGDYE